MTMDKNAKLSLRLTPDQRNLIEKTFAKLREREQAQSTIDVFEKIGLQWRDSLSLSAFTVGCVVRYCRLIELKKAPRLKKQFPDGMQDNPPTADFCPKNRPGGRGPLVLHSGRPECRTIRIRIVLHGSGGLSYIKDLLRFGSRRGRGGFPRLNAGGQLYRGEKITKERPLQIKIIRAVEGITTRKKKRPCQKQ